MRILFFSYAYPNAASPTLGTFNRSLLSALAQRHAVRVVSPVSFVDVLRAKIARLAATRVFERSAPPLDQSFSAIPNVPAEYLPFYYPPKLFRERFGDFLWWSVGPRLEETIRDFRPDVILSYWTHPDGEVAVRAGRRHDIPVVTMVGGSDVLLLARSGRRRTAILNVLHEADAVVTVSRHLAATLEQDGISTDKLHVVRRGVDQVTFWPGDRLTARRELGLDLQRFTMLSVGRLAPVKGHLHLIRACGQLRRRDHDFSCAILGAGPLSGRLQREIRRLHLENSVTLSRNKPQTELARWYRAADVTVLPSLSEGVPNVLLESVACGTPFIASNVGGIPEIADPQRDELVPREDVDALAAAIERRMAITAGDRNPVLPPRRFQPASWADSADELGNVFAAIGAVPRKNIEPDAARSETKAIGRKEAQKEFAFQHFS